MHTPLVTVFIPVYNGEAYISGALESIIKQTYTNLDILVIDDGSTDHSAQIVNDYTDKRVRLFLNHKNNGIPYTRNLGLQKAKGKYIAVMDADDVADPMRIEKQVAFMEKHTDIDAIGTYYKVIGGRFNKIVKTKNIDTQAIQEGLILLNQIGHSTYFIRLVTLRKHHIRYNPDYFVAQDYDLWVQLSKVGQLSILPDVLLTYRTGHANVTKKSKTKYARQRKQINDAIHQDILNFYHFTLTDDEIEAFNEFFNDNVLSDIRSITLNRLPDVLGKMIHHNRNYQLFNEDIFRGVISDMVWEMLNRRKLHLMSKLRLYKEICRDHRIGSLLKDIGYMVPKHLYNLLFL